MAAGAVKLEMSMAMLSNVVYAHVDAEKSVLALTATKFESMQSLFSSTEMLIKCEHVRFFCQTVTFSWLVCLGSLPYHDINSQQICRRVFFGLRLFSGMRCILSSTLGEIASYFGLCPMYGNRYQPPYARFSLFFLDWVLDFFHFNLYVCHRTSMP